jgi:hypothetical protein
MPGGGTTFVHTWTWVAVLFAIALAAPNTAQIMERVNPALDYEAMKRTVLAETPGASSPSRYLRWRPGPDWAAATAVATAISLLSLNRVSEFLYFQF